MNSQPIKPIIAALFAVLLVNASACKSYRDIGLATPAAQSCGITVKGSAAGIFVNHGAWSEFSPDGKRFVTSWSDNFIRVWDAYTGAPIKSQSDKGKLAQAKFSPRGDLLVAGTSEKTVRIFDGFTGSPRTTISFPYDVHTVAFSTDGSRIVIDGGAGPGGVQLADPRSEKPIAPVITVRGAIGGTEFQPTSSRVIMLRFLQSAGLWDSLTGKQMGEELSPASAYEFSPDGRELITVGSSPDFSIRVWSVASRQELMRGEGHKSWGHTIAFSPDRSRILTTSADGTARMWRAKDLAPVGAVMTHDAEVFGAVFSPDGERVLSWGYDNTARLWDGQTGAPIAILPHRAAVVVGTFSPDGTRILTSSVESITRMWDGKTGQPWPCHPVMN